MKSNIQLKVKGSNVPFKGIFFSGGEPHVEIENPEILKGNPVRIVARVGSANDFMMLLALSNAAGACNPSKLDLTIPYFPGARQDRQEKGYAMTVKMYADLINAAEFDTVSILDPHSPVTNALIDRVRVMEHVPLVKSFIRDEDVVGIICPDAGAERRTLELAKEIGCDNVVFARKKRDPRTGSLSGFSLDSLPVEGTYLVADDLCDGGGTFMGLAGEYLKDPKGTGSLLLWVTHGIFSKGLVEMSKYFARIGCSDSFPSETTEHPQLTVVPAAQHVFMGGN